MATKKECDRCHKQWLAVNSSETCAVAIDIPYWTNTIHRLLTTFSRNKIGKTYELCQVCARAVYEFLEAEAVPVND
jgi:hypothetical protein